MAVAIATGKPLSDWQRRQPDASWVEARFAVIALAPPRDVLYAAADARFERMMAMGALDEVKALVGLGLDPALPAMKAHGVPWLRRHLHEEISLEEAAEGGKRDTRRYTRRQATWFRNQLPGWLWLEPTVAQDIMSAQVLIS
jgi:tRNA dimethylallyltransferase